MFDHHPVELAVNGTSHAGKAEKCPTGVRETQSRDMVLARARHARMSNLLHNEFADLTNFHFQRAFRQRKEGYIKKLEQQVRDYAQMEETFKAQQGETYALREYIYNLQSRLMDLSVELPPPPPGLTNLIYPPPHAPPPAGAPEAGPPATASTPVTNPLEVAAQAVAGLSRSEHLAQREAPHFAPIKYEQTQRTDEDTRTAEEITRQLQAEGAPDGLPATSM